VDERVMVVIASLITISGALWLLTPIVRALAERIKPRPQAVDAGAEAFRDEVLDELQQVRREMAELGDRMDFAERLLAKQRDQGALPKPRA
jgi:hypothetical protein